MKIVELQESLKQCGLCKKQNRFLFRWIYCQHSFCLGCGWVWIMGKFGLRAQDVVQDADVKQSLEEFCQHRLIGLEPVKSVLWGEIQLLRRVKMNLRITQDQEQNCPTCQRNPLSLYDFLDLVPLFVVPTQGKTVSQKCWNGCAQEFTDAQLFTVHVFRECPQFVFPCPFERKGENRCSFSLQEN